MRVSDLGLDSVSEGFGIVCGVIIFGDWIGWLEYGIGSGGWK